MGKAQSRGHGPSGMGQSQALLLELISLGFWAYHESPPDSVRSHPFPPLPPQMVTPFPRCPPTSSAEPRGLRCREGEA